MASSSPNHPRACSSLCTPESSPWGSDPRVRFTCTKPCRHRDEDGGSAWARHVAHGPSADVLLAVNHWSGESPWPALRTWPSRLCLAGRCHPLSHGASSCWEACAAWPQAAGFKIPRGRNHPMANPSTRNAQTAKPSPESSTWPSPGAGSQARGQNTPISYSPQ